MTTKPVRKPRVLIAVSTFYKQISSEMIQGAATELEAAGVEYQKISVPGAFEIPAVISYAADTNLFDGFIALGCVIRGETPHFEYVSAQVSRTIAEAGIKAD